MFELAEREFTSQDFKKDWTWLEHKGVISHIREKYNEEINPKKDAIDAFGLPYTSSSSYAMVSLM